MYTCVRIYIYTHIHTYLHTCIHTYILAYIPAYLHIHIPIYFRTNIIACSQTYIHTCIQTYMWVTEHTTLWLWCSIVFQFDIPFDIMYAFVWRFLWYCIRVHAVVDPLTYLLLLASGLGHLFPKQPHWQTCPWFYLALNPKLWTLDPKPQPLKPATLNP